MQRITINGVQADYISVMDRGLHYGDGVFETIACVNNQLQFWPQHLARMTAGAEKLKINFPDESLWLQDVRQLFEEQVSDQPCIIKLMLTRGIGERGYRHPAKPIPTRIVNQIRLARRYPPGGRTRGAYSSMRYSAVCQPSARRYQALKPA